MFLNILERFTERRHQKMADFVVGQRVLDIGYAQAANKFLHGKYVVGYDIEKPNNSCFYNEIIQADARDIVSILAGQKFDTIIMGDFIEHLESPYRTLRDLKSILAGGGRLILSTPNILSFPLLIFELLGSERFFYTKNHLYCFSPRWVKRMLELSGFELLKVVSVGLWFLSVPTPAFMSYELIYVAEKVECWHCRE